MNNLKKYIKIARDITIRPQDDRVQEKILERISNVGKEDKALLDDDFIEYLRKNNSRLYLFAENVRNNPLRFLLLFSSTLLVLFVLVYEIRKFCLPSPKNKP